MRLLLLLALLLPASAIYWTNPTKSKNPPTYVRTLKPFANLVLLTTPQNGLSPFNGQRFSQPAVIVVSKGPAVVSAGITEGAVAVLAADTSACTNLKYNTVSYMLCPESSIVGTITSSNWGASRAEAGTAGIVTPRYV